MGKEDAIGMVNKVLASGMIDHLCMVRMIGNRMLHFGAGSYVSQDIPSFMTIKRGFISSISSNPAGSGGRTTTVPRCLETQCTPDSGKTIMLSRMDTQSRSRGCESFRGILYLQHIGCTVASGLTATGTLTASSKSTWVTALHRNHFSSSSSRQEGTKTNEDTTFIESQTSEDAHSRSDQQPQDGPPPDPPGLFATMGAMTAGGMLCI
jgi:hypothetical protein